MAPSWRRIACNVTKRPRSGINPLHAGELGVGCVHGLPVWKARSRFSQATVGVPFPDCLKKGRSPAPEMSDLRCSQLVFGDWEHWEQPWPAPFFETVLKLDTGLDRCPKLRQ